MSSPWISIVASPEDIRGARCPGLTPELPNHKLGMGPSDLCIIISQVRLMQEQVWGLNPVVISSRINIEDMFSFRNEIYHFCKS